TAFLVVAAPEPDAIREAAYFAGRLADERMPLAGLLINRMITIAAPMLAAAEARAALDRLDATGGYQVTADVLRIHADLIEQRACQEGVADRFLRAHPGVPVATIPAQPADVHDLDGLRAIGAGFGYDLGSNSGGAAARSRS